VAVPSLGRLTDRQLEMLRCRCQGMDNAAIAWKLHLSPETVNNHFRNIWDRLGIHAQNQTGIACYLMGAADVGRFTPWETPAFRADDL
jgi:DNA-binding NarL/FixJ family response regulator